MKKIMCVFAIGLFSLSVTAQMKKDGTPDMRYKANKEMYGSSYSNSSSSQRSTYSTPSYSPPKQERTYESGGSVRLQSGYTKSNGTYVAPHLKTRADNKTYNNLSSH